MRDPKPFRRTFAGSTATMALAAAIAAAAPAAAQTAGEPPAEAEAADTGGLEEIVVTAQRRRENLQDVPIAVAAVTAESLKTSGVETSRDLPQLIPSVQFTRSGASGLFFVRGVGTTNAAVGEEGANAFYVDNVYLGDLGQTINNFNNIDRIEVLKGPQGTLFGRNATGGLVHIITREPGNDTVIDAEAGYANYNTINGKLYAATPITDQIAIDVALTGLKQHDGWGRNLTLNRDSKLQEYWGIRSKLVLRPSDLAKITFGADYYWSRDNLGLAWKIAQGDNRLGPDINGDGVADPVLVSLGAGLDLNRDGVPDPGFPAFVGPAGQDTTANTYALTTQKVWGFSMTSEFDIGFATLTNVAALRRTRNSSAFDVDGGPYNAINIAFNSGGNTFQEELRLASNDTDPFAWQVGMFYLRSEARNDSNFFGDNFTALGLNGQHIVAKLQTNSFAAFAEGTYAITPTTKLTAGVRWTQDKRTFDGGQANIVGGVEGALTKNPNTQLNYSAWTYRVALRQEITDDVSVYASVNRGFKAGSYSLQSPLLAPFKPQYIMAYEAGFKSEFFDRRLRLNISAYHYDISDYQVRSAATSALGQTLVLNAATVKVDGVDVEFEAQPTEQLRIFGGFTWLNSRYSKFGGPGAIAQAPIIYPAVANLVAANRTTCPNQGTRDPGRVGTGPFSGGWVTCLGDVTGNKTPNAPTFTASLGASYTVPLHETGSVRLSALYSYNSGYFFEADNRFRQPAYHLVNGSLEYRPSERFGVEVWARNLFDVEYAVQDLTSGTGTTTALGAPRTYGITAKFDY